MRHVRELRELELIIDRIIKDWPPTGQNPGVKMDVASNANVALTKLLKNDIIDETI